MKRVLAGVFVAVLCLGLASSRPAQAEAAGPKGVCSLFHKTLGVLRARQILVSAAAVPAHVRHGDDPDKVRCPPL